MWYKMNAEGSSPKENGTFWVHQLLMAMTPLPGWPTKPGAMGKSVQLAVPLLLNGKWL